MSKLIGQVTKITGEYIVKSADGTVTILAIGSLIYEDDILLGRKGLELEITLQNGDIFQLHGNAVARLGEAVYSSDLIDISDTMLDSDSFFTGIDQGQFYLENFDESAPASIDLVEYLFGSTTDRMGAETDIWAQITPHKAEIFPQQLPGDPFLDDDGASVVQTSAITINDIPTLTVESTKSLNEDGTTTITYTTADLDGTVVTTASALHGSVVVNNDGTITYTADANYHGTDTITVTATDDDGASVIQTSSLTINDINDAPTLTVESTKTVDEDGTTTITYSVSDIDGTTITTATALHGSVVVNNDGTITYTPDSNYNGTDTISVMATDDDGASVIQTSSITINDINDAPTLNSSVSISFNEDMLATGAINASDVDGNTLSFSLQNGVSAPTGFVLNNNGTYSFDASSYDALKVGDTQDFSIPITISDGVGGSVDTVMNVTINGVNNDMTYTSSVAGYRNVFGYYEVDQNGLPIGTATIAIDDQHTISGGTHIADLDPSKNYGFFIIADGGNNIDTNSIVTFNTIGAQPVLLVNGNTIAKSVFHDNPAFNSDGKDHFIIMPDLVNGGVTIRVEDQSGLGNVNFMDMVVHSDIAINDIVGNDAQANNDSATTTEKTSVSISVLNNDVDGSGDTKTITKINGQNISDGDSVTIINGGVVCGTATLNGNQILFTPDVSLHQLSTNESQNVAFSYTMSDWHSSVNTATVTVMVTGTNDLPAISIASIAVINEDQTLTIDASQWSATDIEDGNLTPTLSANHGTVAIDSNNNIIYTPNLNYYGSDMIMISVTDTNGAVTSQNISVTVSTMNDSSIITSGNTRDVVENAVTSTVIYQATATDIDGDTLTYSLDGTDASYFDINSSTGAVTLKASANYEAKNSYSIDVIANDGTISTAQTVTINVTNVNETPVFTSSATGSVDENSAASTVIYQAQASDVDTGTTLTYSLNGTDASKLNINSTTGEVTLKASSNYETKSSYSFNVIVSDGTASVTKAVIVSVNNLNEAPTSITMSGGSLVEDYTVGTFGTSNVSAGKTIATLATVDPDASNTFTYTLNDPSGKFELIGNAIVVKAGQTLDYETASSHPIRVTTTDQNGLSYTQNLTLTVTNFAGLYTGTAGINAVVGTSEEDVIDGSSSGDTMSGGLGNDTYIVDNVGDIVIENASEGIDTIQSSATYTLGNNIENLTLTGTSNINATGNELNNTIIGNAKNNIITGGAGTDTLDGGAGTDTLDYSTDTSGITVTLNNGASAATLTATTTIGAGGDAQGDRISGFENVTGGAGNDTISGDAGGNQLIGGAGSDTIVAGAGNDTVRGGTDADTLDGGAGTDMLDYSNDSGNITVIMDGANITTVNGGSEASGDQISNFESVTLGSGDDVVIVRSGSAGTFMGKDGNDTIYAGTGNDTFESSLANTVGNDTIYAGDGNDAVGGGLGSDILIAGRGSDVITYATAVSAESITIDLRSGTAIDTSATPSTTNMGTDTIIGFENATGGSGNDTLIGNSISNILDGGAQAAGGYDTAVFQGNFADYNFAYTSGAAHANASNLVVADTVAGRDGSDQIKNIEVLQFADRSVATISIGAATVTETVGGIIMSYTVTVGPSSTPVSVDYSTLDGTALAGSDYTATTGTLTFSASNAPQTQTITVQVLDDALYEGAEKFYVNLSNAINGVIIVPQAIGTINDNETAPASGENYIKTVVGDTQGENTLTANNTFTVTLNAVTTTPTTVNLDLSSQTATVGTDTATLDSSTVTFYNGTTVVSTASNCGSTVTVPAGVTSFKVLVPIVNDTIVEAQETYALTASIGATNSVTGVANLNDNDATMTLSTGGVLNTTTGVISGNITEAGGFAYGKMTLSGATSAPTVINIALSNTIADGNGIDYGANSTSDIEYSLDNGLTWTSGTTLTIPTGSTTAFVRTPVIQDTLNEGSENFTFNAYVVSGNLSNTTGYASATTAAPVYHSATATIIDDDIAPTLSITNQTVNEADGTVTVTVTLSTASGQMVMVNYATSDGSAVASSDYTSTASTLVFNPGETTKAIIIPISNDGVAETAEDFTVTLSNPLNATISTPSATVTINEPDLIAPTATITMGDSALLVGEISSVTVTFSEAVNNFDNSDLTVENGTLSVLSSSDGGITWTGTFTPTANISDTTNVITLANTYTDVVGNIGTGANSGNYTIQTEVTSFLNQTAGSMELGDSVVTAGSVVHSNVATTGYSTLTTTNATASSSSNDYLIDNKNLKTQNITTGSGNDTVLMVGYDVGPIAYSGSVDTGSGNDVFYVQSLNGGSGQTIAMGSGDDNVFIGGTTDYTSGGGGATIDLGTGNDRLVIASLSNTADGVTSSTTSAQQGLTTYYLNTGKEVEYGYNSDAVTVNAGAGADAVFITSDYKGTINLEEFTTGTSDNYLQIDGTPALDYGTSQHTNTVATIVGGAGDDFVKFEVGRDYFGIANTITFNGGDGVDTLFIDKSQNTSTTNIATTNVENVITYDGATYTATTGKLVNAYNFTLTQGQTIGGLPVGSVLLTSKGIPVTLASDGTIGVDLNTGNNFTLITTTANTVSIGTDTTQVNIIIWDMDPDTYEPVNEQTVRLTPSYTTPIILDLNGDGIHTVSLENGVQFDIDADGKIDKVGWGDGRDGMLVHDINHDGKVNDGGELFGSATTLSDGSKASDGYEALRDLDANQDNVIDANDAAYGNLKLWIDANQDGKVDEGEMMGLKEAGVESMNLKAESTLETDNGNIIGLESSYTTTSGETHDMADVWLATLQTTVSSEEVSFDGLSSMVAQTYEANTQDGDLANVPLSSIFTLDQDPAISLFEEDVTALAGIPIQTTPSQTTSAVEQQELYIDNSTTMMIDIDANPQEPVV